MMHGLRLTDNLLLLIVYLSSSLITVSSYSIKDRDVSSNLAADHGIEVWLTGGILAIIFSIVSVILVIKCTDCYNAEVATESHPACGASKTQSSESYGEVHSGASHHQNQTRSNHFVSLPYELNPLISQPSGGTSVSPSAPTSPPPPMGPGGLGGGQWGTQNSPARHRPYEGSEQPPSYNEALFSAPRH